MLLRRGLGVVLEHHRLERALLGELALHVVGHLFGLGLHTVVFKDGDVTDGLAGDAHRSEEQLVRAVAHLRLLTVDERVGEIFDVARGLPGRRVMDDRGVEADNIVATVDKVLPPGLFDIILQLDAERAVVEEAVEAAVDIGGGEDEPAAFAQVDDGFHLVGRVGHGW